MTFDEESCGGRHHHRARPSPGATPVRLAGIDAPEKKQPFGARSKQSLSDLVYRKAVTVEWHKFDRYGRQIGKVIVNGADANLEQLKAGMAWVYRDYVQELTPAD